MILIAGAGLAGLSTAFHLRERDYRIIERGDRPGGLCRTEQVGDYRFDYGGHLLHLQGDDVRGLVQELLGDRLGLYRRRSAILTGRTLTPYPFQAHLHGLPPEVIRDCLLGFIEALLARESKTAPDNFHDWILDVFGPGFARHFFFPFNSKFFKTDLGELTHEWASWSIPRPSLRQVIDGALGLQESEFGYNVEFFYPPAGIEELPRALARELSRPVETCSSLARVLPRERRAVLQSGEEIKYRKLVSTVPLDRLLSMLEGAPEEIAQAARGLRVLSVLCVNLGIAGPPISELHWVYVPGPEHPFHRIGVFSNFMSYEPGQSALYLEITGPGPAVAVDEQMTGTAVAQFKGLPFWKEGEHVLEVAEVLKIDHGYVVYDRFRRDHLPGIIAYLRQHDIEPVGRYGRWEYSTMEEAIRQGREVALTIGG